MQIRPFSLHPKKYRYENLSDTSQPAITCSKFTIKSLKQGVKYIQS